MSLKQLSLILLLVIPMSTDAIVLNTLKHEGGLSDHPADRGGLTKYGITFKTLKSLVPEATEQYLRSLTQKQALEFYKEHYFYGMGVDKYPEHIQDIVFDMNVNHGLKNSTRIIQRAILSTGIPIKIDGVPGVKTVTAAALIQPTKLRKALIDARVRFFNNIVTADASQRVFLKGWINRAKAFEKA